MTRIFKVEVNVEYMPEPESFIKTPCGIVYDFLVACDDDGYARNWAVAEVERLFKEEMKEYSLLKIHFCDTTYLGSLAHVKMDSLTERIVGKS